MLNHLTQAYIEKIFNLEFSRQWSTSIQTRCTKKLFMSRAKLLSVKENYLIISSQCPGTNLSKSALINWQSSWWTSPKGPQWIKPT